MTVEYVLWLPLFVAILMLVVDVSLLFLTHANMYDVARDTSRRTALGEFANFSAAETYAETHALVGGHTYTADVDYTGIGEEVYTEVSVPMADVGFSRIFAVVFNGTLRARVTQRVEPS
ncbi:TadE/TadG family type IV pilus assembly protein [Oceanomicrobium pacificus]|uniref:TadE-like domain-containing protein n=1 Tax=Oceanomicrobium pacificus TaxID=2692916 RepID=A0A6B0TJ71_9RHOB|nr:TadE family protein [Oceanomicrobium pacificus]MXU63926.1 hypothetical protein [Oceanomicrobium pacificus]